MFVLNLLTLFQVFQASFGEIDVFDKQLKKYPKCGQAEFQDVSRCGNIPVLQSVGFFVVFVDNVKINLLLMLFLLCFTYPYIGSRTSHMTLFC